MVLSSSKIVHILLSLRLGHVFWKTVLMMGNNLDDLIPVCSGQSKVFVHSCVLAWLQSGRDIRFRTQHLNQEAKQNWHCGITQMQQEAVKSGEKMKGNTRITGITSPCWCLERSFIWSWDSVGHQNSLLPCPELRGITQKIHFLKASWADLKVGLLSEAISFP